MSIINDMHGLAAAEVAAAGLREGWYKASITASASQISSLWRALGNPGQGSIPATADGVICDKNTVGAFTRLANAGVGDNHLLLLQALGPNIGTVMLYDRLWHNSGLSGTNISSVPISQPALTRWTSGAGVEAWLDVYTAIGATPRTATLSLTNAAGSGQSATATTIASQPAGQCVRFAGATTDTIQSIQSVILSASTGTAGDYGLTLRKLLAIVPLGGSVAGHLDALRAALAVIPPDACLEFLVQPNTASTGQVGGTLVVG